MAISGVALDKKDIIKAIRKSRGLITYAARALNCDPSTLYLWRDKDEDVANAIKEARAQSDKDRTDAIDEIKNRMYEKLIDAMDNDETSAIIYANKAFGGHGDGSGTVKIQVVDACSD